MENKAEAIKVIDDRISEVYDILKAIKSPVREDVLVAQGVIGEDPDEEIAARLWVSKQVEDDENVPHYHDPSNEVIEQILAKEAEYTGDWYHSSVTLVMTEESNNSWTPLQQAIYDLPEGCGVYRAYSYDFDDIDMLFDAMVGQAQKKRKKSE